MAETGEEAAVSEQELAPRHSIEDMMQNMDIINAEIKLIRFISLKITTTGSIWFVEMKPCCLSDYYHEYPIRKTKKKKRPLDPSQG